MSSNVLSRDRTNLRSADDSRGRAGGGEGARSRVKSSRPGYYDRLFVFAYKRFWPQKGFAVGNHLFRNFRRYSPQFYASVKKKVDKGEFEAFSGKKRKIRKILMRSKKFKTFDIDKLLEGPQGLVVKDTSEKGGWRDGGCKKEGQASPDADDKDEAVATRSSTDTLKTRSSTKVRSFSKYDVRLTAFTLKVLFGKFVEEVKEKSTVRPVLQLCTPKVMSKVKVEWTEEEREAFLRTYKAELVKKFLRTKKFSDTFITILCRLGMSTLRRIKGEVEGEGEETEAARKLESVFQKCMKKSCRAGEEGREEPVGIILLDSSPRVSTSRQETEEVRKTTLSSSSSHPSAQEQALYSPQTQSVEAQINDAFRKSVQSFSPGRRKKRTRSFSGSPGRKEERKCERWPSSFSRKEGEGRDEQSVTTSCSPSLPVGRRRGEELKGRSENLVKSPFTVPPPRDTRRNGVELRWEGGREVGIKREDEGRTGPVVSPPPLLKGEEGAFVMKRALVPPGRPVKAEGRGDLSRPNGSSPSLPFLYPVRVIGESGEGSQRTESTKDHSEESRQGEEGGGEEEEGAEGRRDRE